MEFLLIILAVIIIIFIVSQLYAFSSQKSIETYPYVVLEEYDMFQIRGYAATLFMAVSLSSKGFNESSRRGFSILASYIFGNNDKSEKIAMTSPVSMSLENTTTMMFMVPKKYNKEMLPEPNESLIEIKEEPAKKFAAINFGGWASDKKIEKFRQKLITALDTEDLDYSERFYFFGYNPPYQVFNRKNEVLVELNKASIN